MRPENSKAMKTDSLARNLIKTAPYPLKGRTGSQENLCQHKIAAPAAPVTPRFRKAV
jgi:hypothetical protein